MNNIILDKRADYLKHLMVIDQLFEPKPTETTVEKYVSGRKKEINELLNLPKIRVTFEV